MSAAEPFPRMEERLHELLSAYDLVFDRITELIDTSRSDGDRRLNFILDRRYVLKLQDPESIWEDRLCGIARLIERYHSIGVYCPRLIRAKNGSFSVPFEAEGERFSCFVEEYAAFPICKADEQPSRRDVIVHLGTLAARYSNVDISDIYSMWSILDLSPLDCPGGKDEKQENAEALEAALVQFGFSDLADTVRATNQRLRRTIAAQYRDLPRCVFQGDLNSSNILLDNGRFAGLIDFNLSGTDVNINVFVNETNWFPEEDEFDRMTVPELVTAIGQKQNALLDVIFEQYECNSLERELLPTYRAICDLFQFPNVCAMRRWLKDPKRNEKTAALISALCARCT